MSVGGSPVIPDPSSELGRIGSSENNLERLFSRLSAIEAELDSGQKTLSHGRGRIVWSHSSCEEDLTAKMDEIADSRMASTVPGSIRFRASSKGQGSNPAVYHLQEFQANEKSERCRFLELELSRANDRIKSLMSAIQSSDRGRLRNLNDQLGVINVRASTASAELQLARDEVRNLIKVNAAVRERNVHLSSETEKYKADAVRLKKRLSVIRAENSRLSDSLSSVTARESLDMCSARDSARRAETACSGLRQQQVVLEAQLAHSKKENVDLSSRVQSLVLESGHLRDELMKRADEKEKLDESVLELEGRLRSIEADRERLVAQPTQAPSVSESLVASLVDQLTQAKEDALHARSESTRAQAELGELRLKCMQAIHRERHQRRDLDRSMMSSTVRGESLTRISEPGSQVYLKKIRKMQTVINQLNEQIFELEKRELQRAPVIVRRSSRSLAALRACPLVSLDDEESSARLHAPLHHSELVPTVTSQSVDDELPTIVNELIAPDLLNSSILN